MITRGALFLAGVVVLCLGAASRAAAEPVTITGGSIVFSESGLFQAGPISLTRTRGFSVNGSVDTGEGPRRARRGLLRGAGLRRLCGRSLLAYTLRDDRKRRDRLSFTIKVARQTPRPRNEFQNAG